MTLNPTIEPFRKSVVNWQSFIDSFVLMFVLFNPFLMSAYLHDLMKELKARTFFAVLSRAFLISGVVFMLFAWAGDSFFSQVLQVRFAAFLMFGGIAFLIISLRYMISGASMIGTLRGPPEHLAGSLAMPFMIGPGTVSASVLAGARLPVLWACLSIIAALAASCLSLMIVKLLLDFVKKRNEPLVERYAEIVGRVSAIIIGTIALEMIMKGFDLWLEGRSV